MNIKILVAAHKPYRMPRQSEYLPIRVGAEGCQSIPSGWLCDNTGEHISQKNKTFCELTALYWAWKNLDAEYIGLCHYRRYFAMNSYRDKWRRIAGGAYLEKLLEENAVILPKKRDYFIETTYQQYIHAHNKKDLDETEKILSVSYPQYMEAYKQVMESTKGHRFNMMIMRKDLFNSYCEWLFDILFKLETQLDISGYSDYDKRVFGFVSERLLDVWVETQQKANGLKYAELPVVYMEKQNWIKKGANFLKRKMMYKDRQKNEESETE